MLLAWQKTYCRATLHIYYLKTFSRFHTNLSRVTTGRTRIQNFQQKYIFMLVVCIEQWVQMQSICIITKTDFINYYEAQTGLSQIFVLCSCIVIACDAISCYYDKLRCSTKHRWDNGPELKTKVLDNEFPEMSCLFNFKRLKKIFLKYLFFHCNEESQ